MGAEYAWRPRQDFASQSLKQDPSGSMGQAILFDLDQTTSGLHVALSAIEKRAGDIARKAAFWNGLGEAYAKLLTQRDHLTAKEVADKTLPLFERAAKRSPQDYDIALRMGDLLCMVGNYAEAVKYLEIARKGAPADQQLGGRLTLAYLNAGKITEAAALLEKALAQDPQRTALYPALADMFGQIGNKRKAGDYLDKAFLHGSDPVGLADLASRDQDWKRVGQFLEAARQRRPSDPTIVLRQAQLEARQERFAQALAILSKGIEEFPEKQRFHLFAGILEREQKKFDRARVHFQEAARFASEKEAPVPLETVLFEQAALEDQVGDHTKAEALLWEAMRIDPRHHRAMNFLSYSWADKNIRLDEAEQMVKAALALDHDNAAYLDTLAWVYFRQGRYPEALQEMQKVLTKDVEDAEVFDHLGDIQSKLGDKKAARDAWRKALRLDPSRKGLIEKIKGLAQP